MSFCQIGWGICIAFSRRRSLAALTGGLRNATDKGLKR
jgi:hypothetical protein